MEDLCPHCGARLTCVPDERFSAELAFDKGRILCANRGNCPHCGKPLTIVEEYVLKSSFLRPE